MPGDFRWLVSSLQLTDTDDTATAGHRKLEHTPMRLKDKVCAITGAGNGIGATTPAVSLTGWLSNQPGLEDLAFRLRQRKRDQLSLIAPTTDRQHKILLPVEQVSHRRTGLCCRQIHRSPFLTACLVIRPQHRPSGA